MERAPCSPSDALLKVKVFHPSLMECEREKKRDCVRVCVCVRKREGREEGKQQERKRKRHTHTSTGITTINTEDGSVVRGMKRETLGTYTWVVAVEGKLSVG